MSSPPSSVAASTTQAVSASPSATSSARPDALMPRARNAATVASTSPALRAQIATSVPSAAKCSAMARPMPLVPPVTRAFFAASPRSMIVAFPRVLSRSRCKVLFRNCSADGIFRVNEVVEPDLSALAQHHIGVPAIEAVFCLHPLDQLAIGDAGCCIFQRAGAADGHDEILPLQPQLFRGPAFDQVHADGCGRGVF